MSYYREKSSLGYASLKLLFTVLSLLCSAALAQEEPQLDEEMSEEQAEAVVSRREDAMTGSEDPEAERRSREQTSAEIGIELAEEEDAKPIEFYASVRIQGVYAVSQATGEQTAQLSDGNSRAGVRAQWEFKPDWYLFGRGEVGFDVIDGFAKGSTQGDGGLGKRLLYAGLDHEKAVLLFGTNWSAYYRVANTTDRFAVFGGGASGVYNARTAGGEAGTGRAEDVIQAQFFMNRKRALIRHLKPFNLNLQYQFGQPIPFVPDEEYNYSYGASAMLETRNEWSIGLAYNRALVPLESQAVIDAGIDGDATAVAITTRMYGEGWYAAILFSRLRNMEVTDQNQYVDTDGIELYAQWEFRPNWWLVGGGNWLEPDPDDEDAGLWEKQNYIIGGRYSFDSFRRMIYLEYQINDGRQFDGTRGKDEIMLGVRWDWD